MPGAKYDARWLYAPAGRKGIAQGKAKRRPGFGTQQKSLALKGRNRRTNRCQGQIGARHQVRCKSTVAWVSNPSLSMLANRRPSRCQAPGAKQLAPLSTAWQRMATGKETKEGPNRCQAPGAARTCLRRLRQWSKASPVAAPPRDLRAYDHRLRFTCCPPPATWGFRAGNSGQHESRSRCGTTGRTSTGSPTDK